jgi:hypothetical protein
LKRLSQANRYPACCHHCAPGARVHRHVNHLQPTKITTASPARRNRRKPNTSGDASERGRPTRFSISIEKVRAPTRPRRTTAPRRPHENPSGPRRRRKYQKNDRSDNYRSPAAPSRNLLGELSRHDVFLCGRRDPKDYVTQGRRT